MSKALKILFGGGALLLILLLATALAAPLLIDGFGLRQRIERVATASSGYVVHVGNGPRLHLLPSPGIEVGAVTVTAPGTDADRPSARARLLRVDLALRPLFSGRVQPRTVDIDDLEITPDGGGPGNGWRFAAGSVEIRPGPVSPPGAPAASGPAGSRLPVIEHVQIRDASLARQGPGSGAPGLRDIELGVGPIAPGTVGTLSGRFRLATEGSPPSETFEVNASIAPSPDLQTLRVAALRATGNGLALGDLRHLDLDLTAVLGIDLRTGMTQASDIALRSGALQLTGDLSWMPGARGSADPTALSGHLRLSPLDLRDWLEAHGVAVGIGAADTLRHLAFSTDLRMDPGRLALTGTSLELDQSRATGSGSVDRTTPPHWRFDASVDTLDLDRYLGAPGGVSRPGSAPSASLHTNRPRVSSSTTPGRAAPMRVMFVAAAAQGPSERPASAAANATPQPRSLTLPDNLPRDLHLEGSVQVASLRLGGLLFRDASATIQADTGSAKAHLQAKDFYGGDFSGRLTIDQGVTPGPGLNLQAHTAGARLQPLLEDLGSGMAPLSGTADIDANLSALGTREMDIRRSLSGDISLAAKDGEVRGVALDALIEAAGGGHTDDQPSLTGFSRLGATAHGADGVFHTQDLQGHSPLLQVTGTGSVDVAAQTLDLSLKAVMRDPPKGRGIKELEGIPIPVAVTGPWHQPVWQVDIGPALRGAVDRKLERHPNVLKELEDRTGIKGLEKGLRGLLKF